MIGNVTGGSNFGALVGYVLGKQEARLIGGNMLGETVEEITSEFEHVRAMRPHVSRPVWHFSLSVRPEEQLNIDQWQAVAKDYLKLMGISTVNHQYFLALHEDREHEHVHSVVNRIGFNGKLWHNSWDRLRSRETCLELETKYGLKRTVQRSRSLDRKIELIPNY